MNKIENDDFMENKEKLLIQIEKSLDYTWKMHKSNNTKSNWLVSGGLLLSTIVTLVGIFNEQIDSAGIIFISSADFAGAIGVLITLAISFQKAFNFSGKSMFFEDVHTRTKYIRDRLRYKVKTSEDLDSIVDQLGDLRNRFVTDQPESAGMGAVEGLKVPSREKNLSA